MAIFKAVTRKDGRAIGRKSPKRLEEYLKFQTDERGRVLYDGQGKPLRRDGIITALNADEDDFTLSCREIFAQYGVNQRRGSVQYKHYVQGFPPEDNDRMDRETCHRLGVELAQTVWKDFPVLVVSHFDQENDGIYHWHNHFIVGNCNVQTGRKLCTSRYAMMAQKRFVAAQAEANGLARKGLILEDGRILESKQGDRITFGEYQLSKRLEKQAKDLTKKQLREQSTLTQKAELRLVIRTAARMTTSYKEFCDYLKNVYGVETKETRGVISYLHPDRAASGTGHGRGWIRGRSLGKSYEKEAIMNVIQPNDRTISRGGSGEAVTGDAAGREPAAVDGIGPSDAAGSGTAERLEDLIKLYQELFREPEADERDVEWTTAIDGRDEQPADELGPDEGGEDIRSGSSKRL